MVLRKIAKISKVESLSKDVKLFTCTPQDPLDYKAGQFIMVYLQDKDGKEVKRSYSIASTPRPDNTFDLCVKILPHGAGSSVFDSFKENDSFEFEGPLGRFVIEDLGKDHIFIAAGVGIAPIRGHLQYLFQNNFQKTAILYYGIRSDYYFQAELEQLKQSENFKLVMTASKPPQDWKQNVGRVNTILDLPSPENKVVYVCGPPSMIRDVVPILREKGFERSQIKLDIWEA